MAYLNSAAIRIAVQEQLDGTATGGRAVSSGVMTTGIYADLPDEEQARRALVRPRFDVAVTSVKRVGPIGTVGSYQLLLCDVDVRSIYALTELERASDDDLDALRSTGTDDLDRIQQALCYGVTAPLAFTAAAVPTGILSGVMSEYLGGRLVKEDFASKRIEFLSQFRCIVKVSPAVGGAPAGSDPMLVWHVGVFGESLSTLPTRALNALNGQPTAYIGDVPVESAAFDGMRAAPPNTRIASTNGLQIRQRIDGSGGTTIVEFYRLRNGTWTSIGDVSLPAGGGGGAAATSSPGSVALATLEAGDTLAAVLVSAQTDGKDLTATITLGG